MASRYRRYITETAVAWTEIYQKLTTGLERVFRSFLINLNIDVSAGRVFVPPLPEDRLYSLLWDGMSRAIANGAYLGTVYKFADIQDVKNELLKFVTEENAGYIPEIVIEYLKMYIPTIWKKLEDEIVTQIEDILRNSMLEGLTVIQREQEIAKINLQALTKQRIATIVRTEVTRADSLGKMIMAVNNPDITGFRFSAVLDSRTTDMCISRNGLVMAIDDPLLPENTPPLHPNCRSILTPVTEQFTKIDLSALPSTISRESFHEIITAILELR